MYRYPNHLAAEVRFQPYSETKSHKWMRYEGDIRKVVGLSEKIITDVRLYIRMA